MVIVCLTLASSNSASGDCLGVCYSISWVGYLLVRTEYTIKHRLSTVQKSYKKICIMEIFAEVVLGIKSFQIALSNAVLHADIVKLQHSCCSYIVSECAAGGARNATQQQSWHLWKTSRCSFLGNIWIRSTHHTPMSLFFFPTTHLMNYKRGPSPRCLSEKEKNRFFQNLYS